MPIKKIKKALKSAGKSLKKVVKSPAGKVLLGAGALTAAPKLLAMAKPLAVTGLAATAAKKLFRKKKAAPAESSAASESDEKEAPSQPPPLLAARSTLEKVAPEQITVGGAAPPTREEESTPASFRKGGMVRKTSVKSSSNAPARSHSALGVGCAKRGFGKALMKGR